jgi:xanthine dehydrogenase YagR molybdenum-binding subunit
VPDINVIFLDKHDPHVHALGTHTIGMFGNVGIATAIVHAIVHATGKRTCDLPITLGTLV